MPDWANDETVTLESLIAFLTDNKITYVQEEVESDEPAGTILETLPEAGAEIPAGTEVVISRPSVNPTRPRRFPSSLPFPKP